VAQKTPPPTGDDRSAPGQEPPASLLRDDPQVFRSAVEMAPVAMMVVGKDGTILLANVATAELFGYEESELVGEPVEVLLPKALRMEHEIHRREYVERPSARPMGSRRDLLAVARDGNHIPVEVGLGPCQTDEGLVVICTVVDFRTRVRKETELAKSAADLTRRNQKLADLAVTDPLTSLKNRRPFLDGLVDTIERSVRYARPFSLLILDVDHFKRFNDDFGHLVGDEVLKAIAGILSRIARRSDLVARLGGEEFGILLPETDEEGACVLGERFRAAIEAEEWSRRPVTVSVGAVTVDFPHSVPRPEPPSISWILRMADRALYHAKEEGRNRVAHAARDLPPGNGAPDSPST